MRFTAEEFDTMVQELLFSETICFDTLCKIAEKTLRHSVIRWCKEEDRLRNRGYEDDIMQETQLRLIKTTVSHFLLHESVKGPYNNNPEGFEDWMFTVAKNIKEDFAEGVKKRDNKTQNIDDTVVGTEDDIDRIGYNEETIERLNQAFSIALSVDSNVYKVLTWVAQCIFILDADVTKIESNELIITAFENKTLFEMYAMVLQASKKIPWLEISASQNDKIMNALVKTQKNGVTYGDTKYKDFFMKKDGEACGKKSISDWVNRMNGIIRRTVNPEEEALKKEKKKNPKKDSEKNPKKKPEQQDDKKGSDGNEASDD